MTQPGLLCSYFSLMEHLYSDVHSSDSRIWWLIHIWSSPQIQIWPLNPKFQEYLNPQFGFALYQDRRHLQIWASDPGLDFSPSCKIWSLIWINFYALEIQYFKTPKSLNSREKCHLKKACREHPKCSDFVHFPYLCVVIILFHHPWLWCHRSCGRMFLSVFRWL